MDPTRFDQMTRLLSGAGGRRALLRALLGAVLSTTTVEATARKRGQGRDRAQAKTRDRDEDRDKDNTRGQDRLQAQGRGKGGKHKKKRGGRQNDGGQPAPVPTGCCGTASCADPTPGSTRSGCAYAGRSFVGQDHHGATLRGIDGHNAVFTATDHHGSIFADACLQGASFRRANLRGSTWGGACVFNADFTGADLGGDAAGFADARFCRTTMPDGSINNRDCDTADPCCDPGLGAGDPCRSTPDCGQKTCRVSACQNDTCVFTVVADGPSPNDLCDGHCCEVMVIFRSTESGFTWTL